MSASGVRESLTEFRGRAIWIALGCLVCQMGLGLTYLRTGLAVDLVEGLGLTRAELSSAALPQLLFQALASPLVGYLTVRLGASRVLAFSATLFAFVFFGFSRIDSLSGLYMVIAGVGLGAAGMGDITVGHIVSQWFHRNRGLALGIAYAGSNLGGSVIVAIVTGVAAEHGWRTGLLTVVPIALFVLLPTALFLVREPPTNHPAAIAAAQSREESSGGDDVDLRGALRTRSFWILTATLFTFFFYFTGILDHLVLFLVDTGIPKDEAITAFRRAVGLGVASKVLGGFFSDRMPELRATQAVYALLALSSLILLALPHPALLTAFVLSFGFSQACRDVVYPLILGRCFGDRYLGEIYGAMTLTLLPGGALGPIFAAVLHDRLGDYALAFGTFAALNVLALLGLLFVRDERPSASR
jgi:nitrate/nitrite transporter NarK